jgi:hypothetical protein
VVPVGSSRRTCRASWPRLRSLELVWVPPAESSQFDGPKCRPYWLRAYERRQCQPPEGIAHDGDRDHDPEHASIMRQGGEVQRVARPGATVLIRCLAPKPWRLRASRTWALCVLDPLSGRWIGRHLEEVAADIRDQLQFSAQCCDVAGKSLDS